MGKCKEDQPGFWSNEEYKIPGHISNMKDGSGIVGVASARRLWQQKEFEDKSKGRYYDLRSYTDVTFSIKNWCTIPAVFKGFDAAVLVFNSLDEENIHGLQSAAKETVKKLKKESPLLIFEEKGGSIAKDRKLLLLEDVGLVERSVLTTISPDFNLLEGRKERPRNPVDLLDEKKHLYSYKQLRGYWVEMTQMYKEKGYEIVEPKKSPIIERLHTSTFPPGDKQMLKNGFGVRVKDVHCGCTYDVNLVGEFKPVWLCGPHYDEKKHPEG